MLEQFDALFGIDMSDRRRRALRSMTQMRYGLMDRLVSLRKKQGMTQQDIADQLGISRVAVTRLESESRDPRLSTLIRYAYAVGAELDVTVGVVDHPVVSEAFERDCGGASSRHSLFRYGDSNVIQYDFQRGAA